MRLFRLFLPLGFAVVFLWVLFQALAPAQAATSSSVRTSLRAVTARGGPVTLASALQGVGHLGGANFAVVAQGQYAYVGIGPRLLILDITTPAAPTLVGQTLLPGLAQGVSVSGAYAYIAASESGLQVANVANPAAPVVVGAYDTTNTAVDVAVSGSYVYLADSAAGLRVISVATPTLPVEVGFYDTPGSAYGVVVSGTYAYVADYFSGLRIVNVANPAAPAEVGFYDTLNVAQGVSVRGIYAYVADGSSGLRIVNVANPAASVEVGFYDTPGNAFGVSVSGTYAYVADGVSGFRVVNVATPTAPVALGFYTTPDAALKVSVSGAYAYVASRSSGLQVMNVANPAALAWAGAYDKLGTAVGVALSGPYAYAVDGSSGLRVLNVADSATPLAVGYYDTTDAAYGLAVSGTYAYVANASNGLRVVDVATPTAPVEVGFYDTPDTAWEVAVRGNYAYVADASAGLQVVNVTNPASPTLVGVYNTPGSAVGMAVRGNYAYVADGSSGLRIVNVTNPAAPTEVGFYDTPGVALGVVVSGNYAYVADGGSGLRIVNVTNPAAPTSMGVYDTPGQAYDVSLRGAYAYVADYGAGLNLVYVANPAAPFSLAVYDTPGVAWGVGVSSTEVYVADFVGGLFILHHTPLAPQCFTEYTGDNITDFGSTDAQAVRDAVAAAAVGGTVKIAGYCAGVSVQSATTQTVLITKTLTLVGGYTTTDWTTYNPNIYPTTLDAQGGGRVVAAFVPATLQGLNLTNGVFNFNGAGLYAGAAITLNAVNVYSNVSTLDGGGAFLAGPATVVGGRFVQNQAGFTRWGAGAYFLDQATLSGTSFLSNTFPGTVTGQSCGSNATCGGGAFFSTTANPVRVTAATFQGNAASFGAGILFSGPAWVTTTTFINNLGYGGAGGVHAAGPLTVTQSSFTDNVSDNGTGYGGGAAIILEHAVGYTNLISGTMFARNRAAGPLDDGGGAVLVYGPTRLTLVNDVFTRNVSAAQGGALVLMDPNAALTVNNSAFTQNTAQTNGGAIVLHGTAVMTNPLFGANTAQQGAALYVAEAYPLRLVHGTVASPTLASGPAIYVLQGMVYLTNTLVASHTIGLQNFGGVVFENYNLFSHNPISISGSSLSGPNSLVGPAGFANANTYTLGPTSYALDAAANAGVATDYFGNLRPLGRGRDIGYAESALSLPLVVTLTAQPAHLFANGLDEAVLTVTARAGNGATASGLPVTFTAPLGTLANAVVPLNANGLATTTYTVGVVPGTMPLTATLNDLGTPKTATATVTLKPNPLIGTLRAQFGGQTITYTLVVTNVDPLTQTVNLSGSVPAGASLINVVGGVSVNTGGDYGYGYADASNINLGPNQSHTLQWTIQFVGFTGDVVTQGHAESTTARLRLPAALQIFRVLFMPVYK